MNLVKFRETLPLVSYWGMKNWFEKICMCHEALWWREIDCDGSGWEFRN
jgi:hypothetical protein